MKTPAPVTTITSPPAGTPHFTPRRMSSLDRKLLNQATTVQVQLLECGQDITCSTSNLYWNGSAWASTTTEHETYPGFVGVNFFDGVNWQMNLPSAHLDWKRVLSNYDQRQEHPSDYWMNRTDLPRPS